MSTCLLPNVTPRKPIRAAHTVALESEQNRTCAVLDHRDKTSFKKRHAKLKSHCNAKKFPTNSYISVQTCECTRIAHLSCNCA